MPDLSPQDGPRRNATPEQRAKNRERMKIARQSTTPEQRAKESERKRIARQSAPPSLREQWRVKDCERKKTARRNAPPKPFWGVDGEGAGTDDKGRQNYVLMAASGPGADEARVKHRDGAALSVRDCLEFLLSLPRGVILVGFAFSYDVNQILRGILSTKNGRATLRGILDPPSGPHGPFYRYWGDYAILWQPGQYFRVSRIDRSTGKAIPVKSTTRTVYDVINFFQCKFVKALENYDVGTPEERAFIASNKDRRDEFEVVEVDDNLARYCSMECRLLATLMKDFRDVCEAVEVVPRKWCGPGWLAAELYRKNDIPKRPQTDLEAERKPSNDHRRPKRDDDFEFAAHAAYYGGRAEISRIGYIPGPVYVYDLNSAYPAAMPQLPCSMHTRWVHRPKARSLPKRGLYLAKVTFEHLPHPHYPWCGLPFRRKQRLRWPYQGTGWYWSCEIEAARRWLGGDILRVHDLWVAERTCDCRQYDWVPPMYQERKRLGKDTRGYPLKLGLNSLYGKTAQRVGRAPYQDAVAAGLITAMTRARLIEAIGHAPDAVVMIATDAVFSTKPLPLDIGDGLGQWEAKEWPDMFVVKPGVYWSPKKLELGEEMSIKSRGVKRTIIGKAAPRFERAWRDWFAQLRELGLDAMLIDRKSIPKVPVTFRAFHGCALALARGKPSLAGVWKDISRHDSFDWESKRDGFRFVRFADNGSDSLITVPITQPGSEESEGYEPVDFDAEDENVHDRIFEADDQPDYVIELPHEAE